MSKYIVKFESDSGIQIVEDLKTVSKFKYLIRYKTTWLFFFKGWQYILTPGIGGLNYRNWGSLEDAVKWIEKHSKNHINNFEKQKHDYIFKGKIN